MVPFLASHCRSFAEGPRHRWCASRTHRVPLPQNRPRPYTSDTSNWSPLSNIDFSAPYFNSSAHRPPPPLPATHSPPQWAGLLSSCYHSILFSACRNWPFRRPRQQHQPSLPLLAWPYLICLCEWQWLVCGLASCFGAARQRTNTGWRFVRPNLECQWHVSAHPWNCCPQCLSRWQR